MQTLYKTNSPQETFELGEKLAQNLKGGEVICLYGELGAGKTVFAKGLGKGLGLKEEITSPTFTLIQEYELEGQELKFVHMDLYRLQRPEEAEVIGVTDYFKEENICLIEWPEIIQDLLPEERIEISIEGSGELPREIVFTAIKNLVE
ncbi:MAG TPA: tRNA (adenosine(37)-N6)-threonylcarbamoyltransferase complex ATPase subunit type 1 TsaE [Peptococcaceae bacterium]|nr:tRNA (adenosine(37)-N6)-threonylcarbamoyltransferase complex ATPase subunit type 1 TsaE [Peptococcaceae bacterium]